MISNHLVMTQPQPMIQNGVNNIVFGGGATSHFKQPK